MNKAWLAALVLFSSVYGLEKLDPKYQIAYGNPDAETKIVEYFSLSCPKCVEWVLDEFPELDLEKTSFVFHPVPADLLTLQAMVCLERLAPPQKKLFFETAMKLLPGIDPAEKSVLLEEAMEALGAPMPDLGKMEFLEKTGAFQDAFRFLSQEGGIDAIPAMEVNGALSEKYPTRELIDSLTKRSS